MTEHATRMFELETRGQGFYDFTDAVTGWARDSGAQDGLVTLHVKHTSASLVIQENADPDVRRDLLDAFDALAPRDAGYRHSSEGPDDMPAHIRTALTATSVSIPVIGGHLQLGTWQGLYLFEHRDAAHSRQVAGHLGFTR